METTKNYNLKKPAQEEYYNIEDFNGNMDIVDNALQENSDKAEKLETDMAGVQTTADEINAKIGAANNAGGDTSSGTVMAKLNKLLADWTTARAAEIDAIKADVRKTHDNGSNRSAADWAMQAYQLAGEADEKAKDARNFAGAASNNTTTNNTASKTGILSQKESYTHALLEHSVFGLNALKSAISTTVANTGMATNESGTKASAGWWAMQSYNNAFLTKQNTATNNAASKTGILSQKESYTHALLEHSVFGLNALKSAISTTIANTSLATHESGTKASAGWWALQSFNNTETNNGASKTGKLSQKASYTHSLLENATYGLQAIKNIVSAINTSMSRGMVKRVQRGVATCSTSSASINVSISAVNPEKCIVLLDGASYIGTSGKEPRLCIPYLSSMTSTSLAIVSNQPLSKYDFSWQVIEFY